MRVSIDPGHGGADSGAVGVNGIREKDMNLTVALKVRDLLTSRGFDVRMTRETDIFVDLTARCNMANQAGSDIFVSIHHNAGGGDGYEVIHSIHGDRGTTLANTFAAEYKAVGQNAHGVGVYSRESTVNPGTDYYAVIRQTAMTAIISEFCFVDNATDIQIYNPDVEAQAIAKAICSFYGVAFEIPQPVLADYLHQTFTDADNISDFAKDAVQAVSQAGLMVGDAGLFRPKEPVTREEMAVIIKRIKGM